VGITYSSPGVKLVELTVNWLSCEKTFTDTIFVNEYTVPIDAGPDTTINRNDVVTLTASQGLYFYWYANKPAEFNNRFSQSIEGKLLPDQDSVWFYVRVTDFQGCEGLDSLLVTVRPDDYQPVDNFISPNGDGFNDYFDLSLINPFNNCEFTVMNRWGATVYNIDQYQNDWDGNNQDGNPLPDGTYYWILQCGFEVQGTGPVTVLRNAQ
jgi:gliding motility-associated-like protein